MFCIECVLPKGVRLRLLMACEYSLRDSIKGVYYTTFALEHS